MNFKYGHIERISNPKMDKLVKWGKGGWNWFVNFLADRDPLPFGNQKLSESLICCDKLYKFVFTGQ